MAICSSNRHVATFVVASDSLLHIDQNRMSTALSRFFAPPVVFGVLGNVVAVIALTFEIHNYIADAVAHGAVVIASGNIDDIGLPKEVPERMRIAPLS